MKSHEENEELKVIMSYRNIQKLVCPSRLKTNISGGSHSLE